MGETTGGEAPIPVLGERGQMLRRRVPFVTVEAIPCVVLVVQHHLAITGHLRHNRCSGNRCAALVAVHDPTLRDQEVRYPKRVDQNKIRQRRHGDHSSTHGLKRRVMDVDCVDFRRRGGGDRPGESRSRDLVVEPLPLGRGEHLRVPDAGDVTLRVEDDGRRNHRTCQAAAADLVGTGDAVKAPAPQGILERPHRPDLGHRETGREPN